MRADRVVDLDAEVWHVAGKTASQCYHSNPNCLGRWRPWTKVRIRDLALGRRHPCMRRGCFEGRAPMRTVFHEVPE